jgi:hypothetical protein
MDNNFEKEFTAFKEGVLRYGWSSLITFLSAFSLTMSSILMSTDLTSELTARALWVSVLVVATRAGFKAVGETIKQAVINHYTNKKTNGGNL